MSEQVNHPKHYGGADNHYEAIKVIEAWDLGFCIGNTVKYISRAGKKETGKYGNGAVYVFKDDIPDLVEWCRANFL